VLSGGIDIDNEKTPTRSGYGLGRRKRVGLLPTATLAQRGAPGYSDRLEILVLAQLVPYILCVVVPTLLG
jgi:hypothetical protein